GCLAAKDDGALRGQHTAITMRDRGLAIGDLPRAALAAQLPRRLDQQEEAVHAGMAIRKPAAIGVDRQAAAGRDAATLDKRAAFSLGAETEILEKEDRVDREGVIELDDIDILGAEPRHRVGDAARGQS